MYIDRLGKTCCLMGVDTSRRARAVATATRGLSEAGDQSFEPGPAVSRGHLAQLGTHQGWNEEFALIDAVS